jgi:hypothetical protein
MNVFTKFSISGATRHAKLIERERRHHPAAGRRRRTHGNFAKAIAECCTIESLETRRLMSAWTTVEDYQPTGGAIFYDITSDSAGNLYVVGSEPGHQMIREKLAGGGGWSTIYTSPATGDRLSELAVNALGDVYAAGYNSSGGAMVLRRAVGESAFSTIYTGPSGDIRDMAIDRAGDVFTVGPMNVKTVTKKTSTTVQYWVVRKQTAGQGTFATVDQFLYSAGSNSTAEGIAIVESGPTAGIYVVGEGFTSTTAKGVTTTTETAVVRKSTNGGSSWTTANTFRYQGALSAEDSTGEAITADSMGNVYVAGRSNRFILTRKSTNGGTFAIVDAMPLEANSVVVWAAGMATDHSDNVYLVGLMSVRGTSQHSVTHGYIRSNVGGTWATVDDFLDANGGYFHGVTVDPAGDVFVAGTALGPGSYTHGIIRTQVQSAARTTPSSQLAFEPTAASLFSTTSIASASQSNGGRLVDELFAT